MHIQCACSRKASWSRSGIRAVVVMYSSAVTTVRIVGYCIGMTSGHPYSCSEVVAESTGLFAWTVAGEVMTGFVSAVVSVGEVA